MATRQALAAVDPNAPRSAGFKFSQPRLSPTDLRKQVEEKCQDIMRQAEDAAMGLEQELQIQLVKIPKKVRQMSLREFQETFDGDVGAAAVSSLSGTGHLPVAATPTASAPATGSRTTRKARGTEQPGSTRATRKRPDVAETTADETEEPKTAAPPPKRGRAVPLAELKTPAPSAPAPMAAPGTAARQAAPGEMAYSSRGSPILLPSSAMHPGTHSRLPVSQQQPMAGGLPTISLTTCTRTRTVARTARAQAKAAAEKQAEEEQGVSHGIVLTTEDGRQIPLENGLTNLPADMQQAATQQLQSLKGLVDTLLQASQGAALGPAETRQEESRTEETVPQAGTSENQAADLPPLDIKQIRKGKWVLLLKAQGEAGALTQPVPGHEGMSSFAVAKVLGRTGAKAKVQFYVPEGSEGKWAEGPKKSEEMPIDLSRILAVFDSLCRKDRTLPAEALEHMKARLRLA